MLGQAEYRVSGFGPAYGSARVAFSTLSWGALWWDPAAAGVSLRDLRAVREAGVDELLRFMARK